MTRLEKLKKEYDELIERCNKILIKMSKEEAKSKIWKPEHDEQYFVITSTGSPAIYSWNNDTIDKGYYRIGNCFKTEENAIATLEKIEIYTELKRLAEEINTEPINWKNKYQYKFEISYSFSERKLVQDWWQTIKKTGIYSTNQSFLEIAIERIGEEKLLKLFKED